MELQGRCGVYINSVPSSRAWSYFNFVSAGLLSLSPQPFSKWVANLRLLKIIINFLTSREVWNTGKPAISASKGISHCSIHNKLGKYNYYFFDAWPVWVEPKKLCMGRLMTYCRGECLTVLALPITWVGQVSCACWFSDHYIRVCCLWDAPSCLCVLWSMHMQSLRGFESINSNCTYTDHLQKVCYFLEASALPRVSWGKFRYLWQLGSCWHAEICISVLEWNTYCTAVSSTHMFS